MGGLNLKGLSSQALINIKQREQIKQIGKEDLPSRFFNAPDMVVIFESWGCQKNSEALVKRLV